MEARLPDGSRLQHDPSRLRHQHHAEDPARGGRLHPQLLRGEDDPQGPEQAVPFLLGSGPERHAHGGFPEGATSAEPVRRGAAVQQPEQAQAAGLRGRRRPDLERAHRRGPHPRSASRRWHRRLHELGHVRVKEVERGRGAKALARRPAAGRRRRRRPARNLRRRLTGWACGGLCCAAVMHRQRRATRGPSELGPEGAGEAVYRASVAAAAQERAHRAASLSVPGS
mmetsp:Transcript_59227/g.152386  ORF Transcript_59227/g.152386 Transcript_59227/m.152386 type:complete len:226 (-) Transcript_59227:17-694(-)